MLSVRDLVVRLGTGRQAKQILNSVSFDLYDGESLGLVGESGSGKTTIARALLGLAPVESGSIRFRGEEIANARGRRRRELSKEIQVVFQDPYASFNPSVKIGTTLTEGSRARGVPKERSGARLADLLERVSLPQSATERYPSEFSGGQRQRLAIARALMPAPSLVICDEAVSALDVSVQAQVLNLLRELRRESQLSYLFIGHDLNVVRYMSDRIIVLYRGDLLEEGTADAIVNNPQHAYTKALVSAMPQLKGVF
jgi:peptide/nickel transport system ATP-binding protein